MELNWTRARELTESGSDHNKFNFDFFYSIELKARAKTGWHLKSDLNIFYENACLKIFLSALTVFINDK